VTTDAMQPAATPSAEAAQGGENQPQAMNGAQSLIATLLAGGIDTCFANPGTSEMHFVAALDENPGMRCILGLQENVVSGAADGYWRMTDRPAVTLMHCGPGLANALANLHNARRAHSGMVNVVGDMATYHRPLDAPLTADTEGWAAGVSGWLRTSSSAAGVGADAADAIAASQESNGRIATLILPADTAWGEGGRPGAVRRPRPAPAPAQSLVREAADVLRSDAPTLLLVGGRALREAPLRVAHAICAATGATLMAPIGNARISRGAGRVPIPRIPYPIQQALAVLQGFSHVILVGATEPISFFPYPGKPNRLLPPGCVIQTLATTEEDPAAALEALAAELGARETPLASGAGMPPQATGAVTSENVGRSLGALLPENAIVVDEGQTFARGMYQAMEGAPPHDWLHLTGGAIGIGLPLALGASVAAPDRRVVSLQADGSALFTLQALWSQAKEKAPITTIIFANRKYQILLAELANVGAKAGPSALAMMDLHHPHIDWCGIARSFGVPAERADSMERFNELFAASLKEEGPFLIELEC
jgi:acetolactate synthase-1/2/3 large subunit